MKKTILEISFIIFIAVIGNAYKIESSGICTCDSCLDCNEAITSRECVNIKLEKDLLSFDETCIKNPENFNNKIFDCQGNKIEGNNSIETYGIYLENKNNNTIKDCIISKFYDGVYIAQSFGNKIINNTIIENKRNGIYLSNSSSNIIISNLIKGNSVGINLGYAINNSLASNILEDNSLDGIAISFSSNNFLKENRIGKSNIGIFMDSSSHNVFENNEIFLGGYAGIYIFHNSDFNKIMKNKIYNNSNIGLGISNCYYAGSFCLEGCENNTIEENEIFNNKIGVYSNVSSSIFKSNKVCNNFELDFSSLDWLNSLGDENFCNISENWNDEGKIGCSKKCEEVSEEDKKSEENIFPFFIAFILLSILLILLLK
ncbi:MAG: NosD domain-containing protein [Candidatus Aenigmatarchaeota archaeon]|nr:right-handed parallel beta-helix repeat-containing protein [Candidatus Aenigmarchaeota archaeon]